MCMSFILIHLFNRIFCFQLRKIKIFFQAFSNSESWSLFLLCRELLDGNFSTYSCCLKLSSLGKLSWEFKFPPFEICFTAHVFASPSVFLFFFDSSPSWLFTVDEPLLGSLLITILVETSLMRCYLATVWTIWSISGFVISSWGSVIPILVNC